jgi:hypothetical protein
MFNKLFNKSKRKDQSSNGGYTPSNEVKRLLSEVKNEVKKMFGRFFNWLVVDRFMEWAVNKLMTQPIIKAQKLCDRNHWDIEKEFPEFYEGLA